MTDRLEGWHLSAQTEFEWDQPDPIPVFVLVTEQIPGLSDKRVGKDSNQHRLKENEENYRQK